MSKWREVTIGDCRLIHGDCRDVLPSLPDGCADMIFTDPPYGHSNNDGDLMASRHGLPNARRASAARAIQNDGVEAGELFQTAVQHFPRLLASGGCCCCCCCGGGGPDPQFARWSLWLDGPLDFKQMVVWDKGWGLGWHYRRCYETILVAQKRGGPCKWYDTAKNVKNIIRHKEITREVAKSDDDHPTPKPPELAAHFMRLHSQRGETVLDPFMGRAPAAVAAIKEGRSFIGIEIDPEHYDAACVRVNAAYADQALFAGAK